LKEKRKILFLTRISADRLTMKKPMQIKSSLFLVLTMTIFFSCAAAPPVREIPPEFSGETIPQAIESGGIASGGVPEKPEKMKVPEYIMGTGLIPPENMAAFLLETNPAAEKAFVKDLAYFYSEEAAIEGVNHDAAFAQMCLETGFLRYGSLVTPDMYNFCGLGSIGPGQNGERFPDPRTGVRAHIQHLKAYATDAPLKQDLVDPRYRWVKHGSSPAITGLSGTWASDKNYAQKISNILERLYDFSYGS
jgi:hypothetical protein